MAGKYDTYLPRRAVTYVIGRDRLPQDSPHTYYFDKDGHPANEETKGWLHREMCIHMFVLEGRLYPLPPSKLRTEDDYQRLLDTELPMTLGDEPWTRVDSELTGPDENGDSYVERARDEGGVLHGDAVDDRTPPNWVAASRSAWRRALVSRLTVLFEPRGADDPLLHLLADYLARDENWHEWWYDRDLDPLRQDLSDEPWRQPYLRALEGFAFRRGQVAWSRQLATEPMTFDFKHRGAKWKFSISRRHPLESERKHKAAVRALTLLWAARVATEGLRRPEPALLAAAFHEGRHFIVEPDNGLKRPLTLEGIAELFGVPARQIRSMKQRFLNNPCFHPSQVRELLDRRGGRPGKHLPSQQKNAPNLLPLNEIAKRPNAAPFMKMIGEANQIEYGWTTGRDATPSANLVRRARSLRKRGLAQLRRLQADLSRSS
ncbi:MAG: hypothetical protein IH848_01365 [Acidobacteria bacterium]|nr:hypothetical protein [Acidobacteriota bacterium]